MSLESSRKPPDTGSAPEVSETPQERTVRLALRAGQYRVERDEARAALNRVTALLDVWQTVPVDLLRAAIRGDA